MLTVSRYGKILTKLDKDANPNQRPNLQPAPPFSTPPLTRRYRTGLPLRRPCIRAGERDMQPGDDNTGQPARVQLLFIAGGITVSLENFAQNRLARGSQGS